MAGDQRKIAGGKMLWIKEYRLFNGEFVEIKSYISNDFET